MHCGYAAGLGASRVREAPRSVPVLVIMMRMPAGFAVVAVPMLMAVIAVPMVVPVMVPVDLPVLVRRVVMSMAVLVGMAVAAVVMAAIVVVGAALGLERALHERRGAALAAHHLGEHVVILNVDRIGGDLGRRVAVADVPGDPHQAERVLGPHLQQRLRRRLHLDEASVLELQRVAVVLCRRLVEIEQ
jgi:hypothetical protein